MATSHDGDEEHGYSPARPVPEHLGNEDTMIKLGFIDELKGLGINELVNLPQLVVVGDQSSGKSSVLQAITRLPFPVDDGLCTRFPTEVSLQRAPVESLEFSISKPVRTFDVLSQTAAQKKWVDRQSARIDEFNTSWQGKNAEAVEFSHIITQARTAIMGDSLEEGQQPRKANVSQSKKNMLSDATLRIILKGPREINITIIDIPGLVSSTHAAHKMAKALVDHYISNPRSIVLAVAHPANVETQDIFEIIATIQNWKNRVIGVITKCDKIEEGGDDWVQKAIKNDESDVTFDRCLSYGWFALRNLSPAERKVKTDDNFRDKKEEKLFQQRIWTSLDRPGQLGIKNLKAALTKMHNEHVTRSIPELIPEIKTRLDNSKKKIEGLGSPRITPESQMNCLINIATKYSLHAADAIDGHNDRLPVTNAELKIRKIVRDALDDFRDRMQLDYEERFNCNRPAFGLESEDEETWEKSILKNKYLAEIGRCINENRGREMADEVNTAVLRSLWTELTPKWRLQTQRLIQSLVHSIGKAVEILLAAICTEKSLQINIKNLLDEDKVAVTRHANHELDLLLHDEKSGLIITLNSWSLERLKEHRDHRMKHMLAILDRLKRRDKDLVATQINSWFAQHTRIQAIFTTHDKLASYYDIGMRRFMDNVCHQVCERHLLGGKSPLRTFAPDLVTKRFEGNEEALKKVAGENRNQLEERKRLEDSHALLRRAMEKANQYCLSIGVQDMGL
ncbi:hypothetical protein MFRU_004g03470 [Monilinia fructicola]|nr:hypothetical protein MFRU_004g03470 [Monilinia fructicola]